MSCSISHSVSAATRVPAYTFKDQLQAGEHDNPIVKQVFLAQQTSSEKPSGRKWCRPPLISFHQLWTHLKLIEGVWRRVYAPGPTSDILTVLAPCSSKPFSTPAMICQLATKVLAKLWQGCEKKIWVNKSRRYCHECAEKLPLPSKAPLTSMPIGKCHSRWYCWFLDSFSHADRQSLSAGIWQMPFPCLINLPVPLLLP